MCIQKLYREYPYKKFIDGECYTDVKTQNKNDKTTCINIGENVCEPHVPVNECMKCVAARGHKLIKGKE